MDLKKVHTALALANSMIESGEQHSEQSKTLFKEAFAEISPANMGEVPQRPLTFGEKAVGLTFNPANDPEVHQAKVTCAAAIDQMNDFRNSEGATSGQKRHASDAITKLEDAQMRMVKAITWRD